MFMRQRLKQCFVCPAVARKHWPRNFSHETALVKQLKTRIKVTGPMTVADYMKEVLSNPLMGYYMNKDVFGMHGDFITSPEISQMFGEMIGVWFYHQWLQFGSPKQLQFVELGPGRGTLLLDVLRVFKKLGKISHGLCACLVEISPAMRELQRNLIHKNIPDVPVTWHEDISDVPSDFSFYLAHEFFDALPIHQFQRTSDGWREVLVDINEEGTHHLKFCLAPGPTPATVLIPADTEGDQIEVRPQAQVIVERMAKNIKRNSGCSLVIDYGEDVVNRHTLRAFQEHKLADPLLEPGNLDLTANVDFSQIKKIFGETGVSVFGPVTQRDFLMSMGINVRRQKLLENATASQAKDINTAFRMLTEPSQMGECFKFLAAVGNGDLIKPPPGFE